MEIFDMKKFIIPILRSQGRFLYKNSQYFLHKKLLSFFISLFSKNLLTFFCKNIFHDFYTKNPLLTSFFYMSSPVEIVIDFPPQKNPAHFFHKNFHPHDSKKIFLSLKHRVESGLSICPGRAARNLASFVGKFSYQW